MSIIKIKKEEVSPIILLMMMFFCIVGSSITGASARDTLFLTQFDRSLLPLMFALVAGLMVVVISIYNRMTSNLDLVKTIISSSVFFCITLFIIRFRLNGFVIPLFYAWTDVIISITIFQFWLLASEIFNARQAKRLFSVIGIGGSIAGISAGYLMRPFVLQFGAENLLIPTIIFIALIGIFAALLNPFRVKTDSNIDPDTKNGTSKNIFDPYLKSILVMVCAAAICSRIIEYQFKITAANTYSSSVELASFFGEYYMYLNGTTLIMQLFLTGFILQRFGILGGLIIMPLGLIVGSMSFLALANLSSIFFARLFDQAFKFSIQSASNEMLWTTIPKNKARRAKPIIDSSIKSVAEGIIGLIIYIIIANRFLEDTQIYLLSLPVIIVIILWLLNNLRIKKNYILSIEKAINHRHLNLKDIQFDVTDGHIISTIDKALKSGDFNKQSFALDLVKNMKCEMWSETLNKLLASGNKDLQKQIMLLALERSHFLDEMILIKLSEQSDEIGALAITLLPDVFIRNNINLFLKNINSTDAHISAASSVVMLKQNPKELKARKKLNEFLDVKDERTTALALNYLRNSSELLPKNILNNLLHHSSLEISKSALNVAGKRLNNFYLPAIISNLENIKCTLKTRKILKLYDHKIVIKHLEEQLSLNKENKNLKKGIMRCLAGYTDDRVILIIKEYLRVNNIDMSIICSESLLKIAKNRSKIFDFEDYFFITIKNFTHQYFKLHCFKISLADNENTFFIKDQIDYEMRRYLYIILKVVTLKIPNSPIDSHIKNIIENNDKDLPYILEFFETSFSKKTLNLLMPMIDPENNYKNEKIQNQLSNDFFNSWIKSWSESDNNWKSAISIDYSLKHDKEIINSIDWSKVVSNPILSQVLENCDNKETSIPLEKFQNKTEKTMFTILEKTILLKTVDLFQDIPGELLSQVSQISKAKNYDNGETIFKDGDIGDSMFIVLEGEISITKGDKEIALLEKGASLGEMALLDNENRSANAIAKEDSILLKINQDVFYELMESNADIMKQIIKLLTGRIRTANTKLELNL